MSKKPHTAAIIQARMRSTRMPGKVLKPVAGQPLLWHVLHRLKKSHLIQTLCVATTTDPADDELAAYAQSQGAIVVRGPEDDVLARYALAAETINPDVIVRVTADAPLVDASFIDYLISEMLRHHADFVVLKPGLSAIHEGADPMTRRALNKLIQHAHDDPIAREHVCSYFKHNRDFVKVVEIDLPEKWRFKGARLSIDTPADVTFIEAVYQRLHAQAGMATLTDLVALLHREPQLLDLNAHVRQKSITTTNGTVIMRCDGGASLGFGHVRRSLSIARALRDRESLGVRFAIIGDSTAIEHVRAQGFTVDVKPGGIEEADWLLALASTHTPLAVMLDVRTDLSAASVLRLRGADTIVAAIDDASQRRLSADATFYPPVPQVFALDWDIAEREPFVGWEWVALGQDTLPGPAIKSDKVQIIVSMGGSDPLGLTSPAVRALKSIAGPKAGQCEVTVVMGPGTPQTLDAELKAIAPEFNFVRNPEKFSHLTAQASLGLITFGVTAYELGAQGVPAVYICLNSDHAQSASAFERSGMGVSLGVASDVREAQITQIIRELLEAPELRQAMSAAGRMNLDGRGAMRIAARMKQLIEERREALSLESRGKAAVA